VNKTKGMTLVELMVSMVIGLFLTAGLFSIFSMSSTNVTTTSQFNQLQENGRIALTLMERDLSQLGFMGDMTGVDFVLGVNTRIGDNAVIGSSGDCVGAGFNNGTLPNRQPAHFRRLWGYESGVSTASLDCLTKVNNTTDVIQIKRLIGPAVSAGTSGAFYIEASAEQAIFFKEARGPVLAHSRIWEYQHSVYYIKDDADGIPILRRKSLSATGMGNNEPLVEGIENMRFMYGFDNDGDRTADQFLPVQGVSDLMWDNAIFQRLVALRVHILVRAIEPDSRYVNDVTYQLGDKSIAPTHDHFRRKVLSTTIVIENTVLQ